MIWFDLFSQFSGINCPLLLHASFIAISSSIIQTKIFCFVCYVLIWFIANSITAKIIKLTA